MTMASGTGGGSFGLFLRLMFFPLPVVVGADVSLLRYYHLPLFEGMHVTEVSHRKHDRTASEARRSQL